MASSEARVHTLTPARYLGQLCKHFQHRLPVTLAETTGSITFTMGVCQLSIDGDTLVMRAEAGDAAALAQVEDVVARHLLRFAFREPPAIIWQAAAPATVSDG